VENSGMSDLDILHGSRQIGGVERSLLSCGMAILETGVDQMHKPWKSLLRPRLTVFLFLAVGMGLQGASAEAPSGELARRVSAVERPRLFLTGGGLSRLRAAIQNTHREKWLRLKAAVDASLNETPPEYRPPEVGGDETRPGTMNDEMLWQRQYGYRLPGMALVALLDPDPKYFAQVRRWALKPADYPLWGAGIYENTGLAAKHQLFGIAIAYDWLYDRWSPDDRQRLSELLRSRGRILYEAAEGINDRGWWKEAWKQNHAWNGYQALAVTAIAVAGEEPAAGTWLAKALWGGHNIVAALPDDGSYEEGIPYWGYGMEALVRFLAAVTPYADQDFYAAPYFANTHLFRLYLAGPDIPSVANFGDGLTRDWHAMRTTMYRLASQYRNSLTQWLAEALPDREDIDATCWSLLWFDPSVSPAIPSDLRLSRVFAETGFAGARTGWDSGALALYLRSGKVDVSHSHVDVNNFLVNVAGEWLLRDYGYGEVGPGYFNKRTLYFNTGTWGHNCLLIDGRDQRLEGEGRITDAVDSGRSVWWRSDATSCYEGARSVVRELLLLRPGTGVPGAGVVIVRDRAEMERPSSFDFMLQPGGKVTTGTGEFRIQGSASALLGRVVVPDGIGMSVTPGVGERINVKDPLSLRISYPGKGQSFESILVLVALKAGGEAPVVNASQGRIQVGNLAVSFAPDGRTPPTVR